ncbi:hypothetical protein B0H10DRAFT_1951784 [Mycena sp. CBHHK59/15]|nr:hypothetical protein B0H10DRAFT_1951784 [Mycena sp. CBHHK59/15]
MCQSAQTPSWHLSLVILPRLPTWCARKLQTIESLPLSASPTPISEPLQKLRVAYQILEHNVIQSLRTQQGALAPALSIAGLTRSYLLQDRHPLLHGWQILFCHWYTLVFEVIMAPKTSSSAAYMEDERGVLCGSYIWGRFFASSSVHNTRIERLWYDVTHGFGHKWKKFFTDLEVYHGLNPDCLLTSGFFTISSFTISMPMPRMGRGMEFPPSPDLWGAKPISSWVPARDANTGNAQLGKLCEKDGGERRRGVQSDFPRIQWGQKAQRLLHEGFNGHDLRLVAHGDGDSFGRQSQLFQSAQ